MVKFKSSLLDLAGYVQTDFSKVNIHQGNVDWLKGIDYQSKRFVQFLLFRHWFWWSNG